MRGGVVIVTWIATIAAAATAHADQETVDALNTSGLAAEAEAEAASDTATDSATDPSAAPSAAADPVDIVLEYAPEIGGPVGAALRQVEQGRAIYRGLAADYAQAKALYDLFARENPAQALELTVLGGMEGGAFGDRDVGAAGRLSVAARAGVHGRQCKIADVGGQLAVGGEEIVSFIQWLDVCPWMGLPFPVPELGVTMRAFPMKLHERVMWRVTPTLGAPLLVDRGRFTSAGFGFDVIGLEVDYANGTRRFAFAGFSDEISWLVETNDDDERLFFTRFDMWFVRWQKVRPWPSLGDAMWDFFVISAEAIKAKSGAGIIEFVPVRVRGFALGPALVDVDAGVTGTGEVETMISCDHPFCGDDPFFEETIDTDGLPDVDFGFARAYVRWGRPGVFLRAGGGRTLRPTLGAELVLEDRAEASLSLGSRGTTLDLEGHYAQHRFWLDETTEGNDTTWGGALAWSHRLPQKLAVGLRVEAGRSFFADAASADDVPRASFGWRALVTLQVTRAVIRSL